MNRGRRQSARGVTLVEVLLVVAIVGVASAVAFLGSGAADSARLRRSAVMIASAMRVAYAHANASSHVVRIVFNLETRMVSIEESEDQLWLAKDDRTGGAAAATELERKAQEEADSILKGPHAPRPTFKPIKSILGFHLDKDKPGTELERNIRFLQIETSHQEEAVKGDVAYLYFWPGGQTERAAIQLSIAGSTRDGDTVTVLISPLTGKPEMKKGRASMPRPRDDNEESERRDTGF